MSRERDLHSPTFCIIRDFPTIFFIDWSKKYHITCIDKSYANCNYHFKDRDAVTVEVLITNYVPEGMGGIASVTLIS